jgi:hypothetical protein
MKSIKKQVEEKLNIPYQGPLGEMPERSGAMRKLAEKLLKEFLLSDEIGDPEWRTTIFEMMEAYHEATNKQITDKDIERQVKQINRREALCTVDYYSTGFIAGAKAMRDGKIKHKEE